ncbi:MAG: hypothetical protein JW910_23260 [Anaerolineae bacterium]|nr:hypothetical protein [Anaerolineae bacterium]
MVTGSTVEVKITLDRDVASELETLGLLEDNEFMATAIAAALERRRTWQEIRATFEALDAAGDPMSMEEINAEIKAYRAEKRRERESRA